MEKMTIIWANTIEHTGGTLLCNAILSNFRDPVWLGDVHLMQRGNDRGLDDYPLYQWGDRTIELLSAEELSKEAILLSSHHTNSYSPSMREIISGMKLPCPVVMSIRDPLLIINTWTWWSYAIYGVPIKNMKRWERQMRVNHVSNVIVNTIDAAMNNPNVFLFTIGLPGQADLKLRMQNASALFKRLGVEFTTASQKFFEDWKPMNETRYGHDLKNKNGSEEFYTYKNKILTKDVDFLMENYDVEMHMLNNNYILREKLISIGYENLAWW